MLALVLILQAFMLAVEISVYITTGSLIALALTFFILACMVYVVFQDEDRFA